MQICSYNYNNIHNYMNFIAFHAIWYLSFYCVLFCSFFLGIFFILPKRRLHIRIVNMMFPWNMEFYLKIENEAENIQPPNSKCFFIFIFIIVICNGCRALLVHIIISNHFRVITENAEWH